jgi:HlyD family secretion protein
VQIAKRSDVLRVPNAAIRFRPTNDMFAALNQPPPADAQSAGGGRRGRGAPPADTDAPTNGHAASPAGANAAQTPSGQAPRGRGTPGPAPFTPAQPNGPAGGTPSGGFSDGTGDRRGRMMDRFKTMSPDEQTEFLARMKDRGVDVSGFEAAARSATSAGKAPKAAAKPQAETIDALFAPLPPVESRGRVWLYVDKQLKPVNLRLGITDGTSTEVVSGELQPGFEVVTGVQVGNARAAQGAAGGGNPLLPQGGRGPGGFGGGGFGGGGRGR